MEKTYERRRQQERNQTANEDSEVVLDLENFTTLDAVGCVDGKRNTFVVIVLAHSGLISLRALGDEEDGLVLEDNPVGQDCVKKVEAHYCDICKRYLSRAEPSEKVIELHCRTRFHHLAFEQLNQGTVRDDRPESVGFFIAPILW